MTRCVNPGMAKQAGKEGTHMISANISNAQRRAVYRRDCFACALCDDRRTIQVHHVVPRGEGGTNHAMNLITLCSRCHALAHGTNLFDPELEISQEDILQAITEYMADYYAPVWNPWARSVHDGGDWKK